MKTQDDTAGGILGGVLVLSQAELDNLDLSPITLSNGLQGEYNFFSPPPSSENYGAGAIDGVVFSQGEYKYNFISPPDGLNQPYNFISPPDGLNQPYEIGSDTVLPSSENYGAGTIDGVVFSQGDYKCNFISPPDGLNQPYEIGSDTVLKKSDIL